MRKTSRLMPKVYHEILMTDLISEVEESTGEAQYKKAPSLRAWQRAYMKVRSSGLQLMTGR